MKRILLALSVAIALVACLALPTFAQTYVATKLPGQPLSSIAAEQIITNSGLPPEQLEDGETNSITRCRDAVNAYRYAHLQLYKKGWYRGISEDHMPLLTALVDVLQREGYTSEYSTLQYRSSDMLQQFFYDSDTQNAKELGYISLEALYSDAIKLTGLEKNTEADSLIISLDSRWK